MTNLSKFQLCCFVFAATALALLAFSGCAPEGNFGSMLDRSSIAMSFFINETGRPLEGALSINGNYLGNTSNGSILVSKKLLVPGSFALSGSDASGDYEFYFGFSSSDIGFDSISFSVPEKDYEAAVFDASKLDTTLVEKEVFSLANEERAKQDIAPLRWNAKVAVVAGSYSEALAIGGFHHTDLQGRDVKQRLSDSSIIFVAANENLFLSSSMKNESDLAGLAIKGWLDSPGHRATLLDRDLIYSDAGVGVHCERKECYVVMDFAAELQKQDVSLNKGWATFYYLNNPGYNFGPDNIPVRLKLSSSAPVNLYVIDSYDSYKKFASSSSGEVPGMISEFKEITAIDKELDAARGSGMIIDAHSANAKVDFSLDFS